MEIKIGHASIDENNKITGGQAGDQNKKEVCTRSYYIHSKGWYLLRPKSIAHANAIAEAMVRACNNDNIGYDQNNRLGVIKYGTNSTTKTECDCSSLVRQCVIEGTGIDAGNFTTANEKNMLLATRLFENAIPVTSTTAVYNGDILVTKTKGHTVIVVSGNPRKEISTSTSSTKLMKGMDVSKYQANNIDYAAAKNAGYDFVIIRIGYNGSKDIYFDSNYTRAKAAGMKVGAYFYTIKLTEADAINDANRVLSWLGNKTLEMGVAYDMEETSMKIPDRKDLNANQYNAFAKVIKSKGYISMLYTGSHMFKTYFNKDLITDPLWIASYGNNDGFNHGCPNVGKTVAIHQYTSAAIPSDFYATKLDRNQMMISYDEFVKQGTTTNSSTSTNTSSVYTHKDFVREVQIAIGAKVDGIPGKETLSKTVTVSKTKNRKHVVVKPIQKYLNSIGFNCGKEDGIAGIKFESAIKLFQKVNGCISDGEITAQATTWKKLLKLQ